MKNRVIRKYGNSYVILLSHSDMKDYDLKEGDELDMEEAFSKKNKGESEWKIIFNI